MDKAARSSAERLLIRQEVNQAQINKIIENFKKRSTTTYKTGYLKSKLESLTEAFATFVETHRELLLLSDVIKGDEYLVTDVFSKFEEKVHECRGDILDSIENLREGVSNQALNTSVGAAAPAERQDLKLPKVELPKFSGDYTDWFAFRDLFHSLVHTNASLSAVQKIHYLKSQLVGEAASIVKHLAATGANYTSAWNAVKDRYDNKRLLVNTYLRTMLSQRVLTAESSAGIKLILDTTRETVNALKNLEIDVSSWDPIIIYLIVNKLDTETHRLWEQSLEDPKAIPVLDTLFRFLETRFQSLEFLEVRNTNKFSNHKTKMAHLGMAEMSVSDASGCEICGGKHSANSCRKLMFSSPNKRREIVESKRLCYICLASDHQAHQCKVKRMCKKCSARHHTLLHLNKPQEKDEVATKMAAVATTSGLENLKHPVAAIPADSKNAVSCNVATDNSVLLATALVKVSKANGELEIMRALVDQGSQCSLITERAARRLGLPRKPSKMNISGLGSAKVATVKGAMEVALRPHFPSDFQLCVNVLILKEITGLSTTGDIVATNHAHLLNLELADPEYHIAGPIDLLLGADVYGDILLKGISKGPAGTPVAQHTEFGWIVSGPDGKGNGMSTTNFHVRALEIDGLLRRFWELEEVPSEVPLSEENRRCEDFYARTVRRLESGRYVVSLPLTHRIMDDVDLNLGSSKGRAVARLLQMERKFQKESHLKETYADFMQEYQELGHMSREPSMQERGKECFLPHHAVLKLDSTTTKLRVVFDASSKTDTGKSLNDSMLTGPTLQEDMTSLMLRWRKHRVAFMADVEKMYRQIWIQEEDRNLQKIVWRTSDSQPIQSYCLNTVTYGTSSAPYLAVRTLWQLARDEAASFPMGSSAALSDFYVDDVMSGADDIVSAAEVRDELIKLLARGGFNLRKWVSNRLELVTDLPAEVVELAIPGPIGTEETVKSLGLRWSPISDYFDFRVKIRMDDSVITKRRILSETARLFDPLGWLAPSIIIGKMLMQELWIAGSDWDSCVPGPIGDKWRRFVVELPDIEKIKIRRWIGYTKNARSYQLHGFSDASEKAYSAVVYMRIESNSGEISTDLITAKTRVAPIKHISLPRLELCGALLLARLMQHVKDALKINEKIDTYLWTDSRIVLAWIQGSAQRWKTFVANRVSEIQLATPIKQWGHVAGKENPADAASRGVFPSELGALRLWWEGPTWLRGTLEGWPSYSIVEFETEEEKRKLKCSLNCQLSEFALEFSSLTRLKRVTGWCLRFAYNTKHKTGRRLGALSVREENDGLIVWIKRAQQLEFGKELHVLRNHQELPRKNKLINLNPYIDEVGILRVGGRLQHANIEFDRKHPIIIPAGCQLATLLIRDAHITTMHGGNQLTMCLLRERYWIPRAKAAVKSVIHRCIICHRHKCRGTEQLMGQLPKARVTIGRVFSQCGVDYAGPIEVRLAKGRGRKCTKGYICIFVCLATRAVHLEAVTDLTAMAFLAAMYRFTSRRGTPSHIYSDNGTNFVGAERIYKTELASFLSAYNSPVVEKLTDMGIQWHRIPPSAPHFGGLWEAGVKSIKHHLRRIVGNSLVTFEELATVLTQIEGVLNSRPLCPISADPDEWEVLTPGHFLIGTSILAPTTDDVMNCPVNRLDRWQLVQKLHQTFWAKWSSEYLSRLQQRPKWMAAKTSIKVGELVLIREDNLPPSRWMLGRVIDTHTGADGLVRVVSLKTKNGTLKRAVTKVSVLPVGDTITQM